jgi:FAD/FMN-containing dehydrogenase
VVLGIFLAITGRFIAAGAARGRSGRARKRLNAAVASVAQELVVEPVEVEVSRLGAFNAALKKAGPR